MERTGWIFAGIGIIVVLGALFVLTSGAPPDAMQKEGSLAKGTDSLSGNVMEKKEGTGEAMEKKEGSAAELQATPFYKPFSLAEYEAAKASGKRIFLEFYANWCPICSAQKPVLESAFRDSRIAEDVAGFQVNYKDSETDEAENALARQFGIVYQHTHVLVDSQERLLLKEQANWDRDTVISKLAGAGS